MLRRAAQHFGLLPQPRQQHRHVDELFLEARRRRFKPRQHQQVIDQSLHTQRLLMHGGKMFLEIFRSDVTHAAQRLDISAQHRDGRAQLV